MASTNVVWELTVYAPKSEDPTETTVLSPRPGSAHADPFVVTSAQGIAGTKPYLGIPKGRTGAIDAVTKRTTTGNLTLSVFDVRVTPGGGNAQRWSTAFVGDALGRPRLKGCKFRLRRSLNGGAMTTYQTGRIRNVAMSRALWLDLDVKDFADDLTRPIFTGAPHASVAGYAAAPALLPLGASQAWANLAVTPPLAGTLTKSAAGANGAPDVGSIVLATPASPADAMVTKALLDASKGDAPRIVKVTVVATSAVGYFRWPATDESTKQAADGRTMLSEREFVITGGPVKHYGVQKFPVWTLPASDTRHTAFPAGVGVGTAVTVQVFLDAPPSKTTPILIGDVHPVQLWADLIDGKFSRTYDYDAPRPLAGRDTSPGGPWATLIADLSFGTMRDVVDQQWKGSDYIEKVICQRFNLAYTFDENGNVVPVDLRRSASLAGVPTLTDDDLVADVEPQWDDSRDGAITAVVYDYQVDTRLNAPDLIGSSDTYPDVVPSLVSSEKSSVLIPNDLSTFRDVGEKVITIDARATRVSSGDWLAAHFGLTRLERVKAELARAGADFLRPFGAGTLTASLTYRGASALAAAVRPGMFRIINHSKLPNPATNERGGPRLVLALSVNDVEGGRIVIQWLDAGDGAVAVAPTISSIAAAGATAVDVALVLNAATDPADIWVAVTGTGVGVRPADSAAEWVLVKTAVASGTLRVTPLPDAKRVWVRAQAHGAAANVKLPSAWAYPPAPGYVDLAAGTPIDDGSEDGDNPPLGGGTPISPPIASLDYVSEDDTQVTIALTGVVGDGGAGPIEYQTRVNNGAWSAWSTAHPNWSVPRAVKLTKTAYLQVRQADGQVSQIASYAVTGAITAINIGSGKVDPGVQLHGTSHFIPRATDINGMILDPGTQESQGKEIRRLYAKPLFNSPNDLSSVADGTGYSKVAAGAVGAGGAIDLAGSAWLNRHLGNVADGGGYSRVAAGAVGAGGAIDFGGAAWLNRHLGNIADGAGYRRTTTSEADGGGYAYGVIDATHQIWADSAKPLKVGTPGVPGTLAKTIRVVSTLFVPMISTSSWSRAGITLLYSNVTATTEFTAPLYLPLGATITTLRWRIYTTGTYGDFINLNLYRYDDTGSFTFIGTYSGTLGYTGYGTVTVSVSETLTAGYNYVFYVALNGTTSGVAGGHRLMHVEADYLIPSYDKGI